MGPEEELSSRRRQMVELIAARGVEDEALLAALRRVPRHELVPADLRHVAYEDRPLPIGRGQTISQPFIVAYMIEAAAVLPGKRVLEIGTGSGYQTALLCELQADVYSIDIDAALAEHATAALKPFGYDKLHLRAGDGSLGWPEAAPFDAIIVSAAPAAVPRALVQQLATGGRLVIPVGYSDEQVLEVHERHDQRVTVRQLLPVRFVPMSGEAGETLH